MALYAGMTADRWAAQEFKRPPRRPAERGTCREKAMVTLETLRQEKKSDILRLARIHGCRNVRVFGSVATGENNVSSDVDFLVDLENGRGLLDLGALSSDLHDLLGVDVNLLES
jgi:predicted nucleotidyltransferase